MPSFLLITAVASLIGDSSSCQKAVGIDARAQLKRAAERTGFTGASGRVVHVRAFDLTDEAFQSDRPYAPPFMTEVASKDQWLDVATGVERVTSHSTIGGYEYGATTIGDARASYLLRDTTLVPDDQTHGALYATRPLSVWAMLGDWLADSDVRVEGRCMYRDYTRLVLSRRASEGSERLFIDEKSGYPTKLDRVESHYLWGQVHVEFVYSTWVRIGSAHLPIATARVVDGTTDVTRTFATPVFVSRDSAPLLTIPARSAAMRIALPAFLEPSRPDTVRVNANTFLLRNRGYTEAVTLARDTVFVFDATQADERVHQDSVWIGALFPGRHPIVVVITDLAWPHVAGVRAWVARGATIVSHRAARSFLTQVVNRRWTLAPDLLERRRASVSFRFRAVGDSLRLAGGDITLFPIDGAASEVALAAFVRPGRFLWASDFIQNVSAPTQYLDDVFAAVTRMGISPANVAAEHAPLTAWERLIPLAEHAPTPTRPR
ncbi:MAG: hypothetical protein ABJF01_20285 [bacterium]